MSLVNSNFVCPVCNGVENEFTYYGFGQCNHPTCAICAIKLQKFSSDVDYDLDYSKCVICKQKIDQLIVAGSIKPFEEYDFKKLLHDEKHSILFESKSALDFYKSTLKISCPKCNLSFDTIEEIMKHVNSHKLRYCELCIDHKKCLLSELEVMTDNDYHQHRNRNHRKCKFCDTRFYDESHLIKHVKEKHFLCDICHRSRGYVAYSTQVELLRHYCKDHHMCDNCREMNVINVFDTEYALKTHKVTNHSMSLINEGLVHVSYGDRDLSYGARRRGRENDIDSMQNLPTDQSPQSIPTMNCEQEFPRLGATDSSEQHQLGAKSLTIDENDSRTAFASETTQEAPVDRKPINQDPNQVQQPMSNMFAISVKKSAGRLNNEDFPSLSMEPNSVSSGCSLEFSKLSINRKPAPVTNKKKLLEEDFPSLGGSARGAASAPSMAPSKWKPTPRTNQDVSEKTYDITPMEPPKQQPKVLVANNEEFQLSRPGKLTATVRQKIPNDFDFPSLPTLSSSKPQSGATVDKIGAWGKYVVPVEKKANRKKKEPERFLIDNSTDFPGLSMETDNKKKGEKNYTDDKKKVAPVATTVPRYPTTTYTTSDSLSKTEYIPSSAISSVKSDPLVLIGSEEFSQMKSGSIDLSGESISNNFEFHENSDDFPVNIRNVTGSGSKSHTLTTAISKSRSPPAISSESDFPKLNQRCVPNEIGQKNEKTNTKKSKINNIQSSNNKSIGKTVPQSVPNVVSLMDVANSVTKKQYTPLPDADERNESMAEFIYSQLPQELAYRLLAHAYQYRSRELSVRDFLDNLQAPEFRDYSTVIAEVLPRMCSLLPDIPLQCGLVKGMPKSWIQNLKQCVKCEQVLEINDLALHNKLAH